MDTNWRLPGRVPRHDRHALPFPRATFLSHDIWLGFFLITGLGFGLFYATALFGRLWCGWACPQTVFLEHVYRRIERWIEGDAPKRRQLDNERLLERIRELYEDSQGTIGAPRMKI